MHHKVSGDGSASARGGLLLLSSVLILQHAAGFQAPRSLAPVSSYRNECSSSHSRHGCIISAEQIQQRRRLHGATTTLQQKTTDNDTDIEEETKQHSNILSQAYHLYVDYFDRLWSDTDVDHRQKRARQRAHDSVLRMKNMVGNGLGDEYLFTADDAKTEGGVGALIKNAKKGGKEQKSADEEDKAVFSDLDEDVRRKMEDACDLMLEQLDRKKGSGKSGEEGADETAVNGNVAVEKVEEVNAKEGIPMVNEQGELVSPPAYSSSTETESFGTELTTALTDVAESSTDVATKKKKKKKGRSVLFGATMGLAVAGWVYSGNIAFTALFTLMTALGQLEYYRMVMNAGIYPARRISVLGACATFVTALFAPDLHQIVLPVFSTWTMIWFLTMRRNITTISEIATTFTGMFYLGYIPSFWVRIRQLGADVVEPTRLMPLAKPLFERLGQNNLLSYLPKKIHYPITTGSNFIFWTWLCIAFSDVGGYFAGRKFGKTKLGAISPAAGKTSPNKTVEGVIGGCAFSLVLATLGAWIQKWPYWFVLGPIHGVTLALLGLVGDLTASMLKRDAGLKDFGDLIPEHGGIMDRVDSYIFTAPYGWLMCGYVIPALKKLAEARAAVGVVV